MDAPCQLHLRWSSGQMSGEDTSSVSKKMYGLRLESNFKSMQLPEERQSGPVPVMKVVALVVLYNFHHWHLS